MNNAFLKLTLDVQNATWRLEPANGAAPLTGSGGAKLRLAYRRSGKRRILLDHWQGAQISQAERNDGPHGPGQTLTLKLPVQDGVACEVTFFLPEQHPLLLWQLKVHNQSSAPLTLDRLELLRLESSASGMFSSAPDPAFWANGWQSWSFTATYSAQEQQRRTRLGPFNAPMVYNSGGPRPNGRRGHFSGDLFGIAGDRRSRQAILLGFLSQRRHFGSLEARLQPGSIQLCLWANGDGARLEAGQSLESDRACLQTLHLDDPAGQKPYLQAAAREHGLAGGGHFAANRRPPESGWCSWYHFYQNVTDANAQANLAAIESQRANLPLQLVQLDDGFEAQVGDWFKFSPRFPHGVAPLAAAIRQANFEPGLWLAPFIVHPKSELASQHPDWLLRNRFGQPVNAGFVWNAFNQALDLTVPEALEYACSTVRTAVQDWGYSFLKLDFLYAAALPGRYHDPSKTRAEVLRLGLEALRRAAGPDTLLLGCGCPLGSAIGLVDAMRIGADTDPSWAPHFNNIYSLFGSEPHMPSARNSMHNALSRAPLHGQWWVNDPDCLLLRPNSQLSEAEVQFTATVIALTGGQLLLSDDLPALPPARLRLAQQLLPMLPGPAQVLDWFDQISPAHLRLDLDGPAGPWSLLALLNWNDEERWLPCTPAEFHLPPGKTYLGREFWSGQILELNAQSQLKLPAHGAALLAVRPSPALDSPAYLGSDLHISQGMEVQNWQAGPQQIRFTLARPGQCQGQIFMALPRPPQQVTVQAQLAACKPLDHPLTYCISLAFHETTDIIISY